MIASKNGPLIALDKLCKTYDMGKAQQVKALVDVTLNVYPGEYIAIMGPSGSGKSTLMNMLGCLDTPSSGSYLFKGQDISEATDDELAHIRNIDIGFVFQTFNLLARSSAEANVELPLIYSGIPREERKQRAQDVLDSVGMGNRANHKPSELSGGERQRVAIARALINRPAIILADEPTGNLDSKTGAEILSLFDELNKNGNTIIVVTHDRGVASYTKRMILLHDGAVRSDQTVKSRQAVNHIVAR